MIMTRQFLLVKIMKVRPIHIFKKGERIKATDIHSINFLILHGAKEQNGQYFLYNIYIMNYEESSNYKNTPYINHLSVDNSNSENIFHRNNHELNAFLEHFMPFTPNPYLNAFFLVIFFWYTAMVTQACSNEHINKTMSKPCK